MPCLRALQGAAGIMAGGPVTCDPTALTPLPSPHCFHPLPSPHCLHPLPSPTALTPLATFHSLHPSACIPLPTSHFPHPTAFIPCLHPLPSPSACTPACTHCPHPTACTPACTPSLHPAGPRSCPTTGAFPGSLLPWATAPAAFSCGQPSVDLELFNASLFPPVCLSEFPGLLCQEC